MDAIEFLIHQHRSMEDALGRILETEDEDKRRTLFAAAADHLTVHIAAEEQVFYPAVRAQRTEDTLLESLEEHLSLKRLLADLVELSPGEKTFEPKLEVLKEQAEHHHKEEEEDLFPAVRKCMSPERLQALAEEMLALQRSLRDDGAPREAVADQTHAAAALDGTVPPQAQP